MRILSKLQALSVLKNNGIYLTVQVLIGLFKQLINIGLY